MKQRNIAVCLLLYIFTCGIYGIFWFISLTDEMRYASGDDRFSGGMAFLLSLVTCGIYQYFWAYQMGKATNKVKVDRGLQSSDNSILYIVLCFFGLNVVNMCLIQNDLNELSN